MDISTRDVYTHHSYSHIHMTEPQDQKPCHCAAYSFSTDFLTIKTCLIVRLNWSAEALQKRFSLSLNTPGYITTESKDSPPFVCVQSIWVIENFTLVGPFEFTMKSPT
uniref:Uncharacterized protein n=1 Tax=Opuntia streptacantha TaxID=393608 RepID=A0A7C9EBY3_OPUST